jgi:hypothetical protein
MISNKPLWYKSLFFSGCLIATFFLIVYSFTLYLHYTEPALFVYQAETQSHIPVDKIAPSIDEMPLKYEYPLIYWVSRYQHIVFTFLIFLSIIMFFSQNIYKRKPLKDWLESDTNNETN